MELRLELSSPEHTRALGLRLGRALPPDAIVLVQGPLGAGKTTLIKAICEGLGIAPEVVISPTYTLVNVYPGRRSVYHVDLFRLEHPEALLELDRADWINPAGPTLIEWPELAEPLLAGEPVLRARLELPPLSEGAAAQSRRMLTLSAQAPRWGETLRTVQTPASLTAP